MNNDEMLIMIQGMFEKNLEKMEKTFNDKVDEVKNHMGIIAESLRSDIKAVAEGHDVLNKRIDELDKKIIDNTNEIKSEVRVVAEYVRNVDEKLTEHEVILKRVK